MITTITAYIVGVLTVASLLMAWFYSTAPIHVLHMLRRLGWKKDDTVFWNMAGDEWESTWATFEYILLHHDIPEWLAALVQCKYCLSFHISFWTALAVWVLSDVSWVFIPAATFSWPVIAIYLMNKVKDNEEKYEDDAND